jgi:hypothetical protein
MTPIFAKRFRVKFTKGLGFVNFPGGTFTRGIGGLWFVVNENGKYNVVR